MRHIVTVALAVVTLTASFSLAQTSPTAEVQFKVAVQKEEVEGDIKGALADYTKLAEGTNNNGAS